MKLHLISICLCIGSIAIAQPSREEIKKHKIRIVRQSVNGESNYTESYWYDQKGNDSILLKHDKKEIARNEYQDGRLTSIVIIDEAGKEKDSYIYAYDPDGSYKITHTDAEFGMKSYEWFNAKNKKTKSQSPDGNTLTYNYDVKGKLAGITSDGANGGIKVNRTYLYNTKGHLIKEDVDIDGSKSATTYFYNAKNQVTKEISRGRSWGETFLMTVDYTYNPKGLVSKKIINRKDGDSKPVITTYTFTYEYY